MHDFNSFIKRGFREWTTWIGIGIIILTMFAITYHNEINQLIISVLTSQHLADKIVDGIGIIGGLILLFYKHARNDDKEK